MLSRGPTQDARFCTMCLYVYDELRSRPWKRLESSIADGGLTCRQLARKAIYRALGCKGQHV